jgi:hypothetical protein
MCRYRALCEFAGCLVPIVLETFFGVLGDMRVAVALYLRDPWVQSERLLIYFIAMFIYTPSCVRDVCSLLLPRFLLALFLLLVTITTETAGSACLGIDTVYMWQLVFLINTVSLIASSRFCSQGKVTRKCRAIYSSPSQMCHFYTWCPL